MAIARRRRNRYVGGEFTEMNGEAHGTSPRKAVTAASSKLGTELNYRVAARGRGSTLRGWGIHQFNSRNGAASSLEAEGSGAVEPDIIGGAATRSPFGGNVVVGGFLTAPTGSPARTRRDRPDDRRTDRVGGSERRSGLDGPLRRRQNRYVGGVSPGNGESRSGSLDQDEDGALTLGADLNGTEGDRGRRLDAVSRWRLRVIEGVNTWERLAAFEIEGEGATSSVAGSQAEQRRRSARGRRRKAYVGASSPRSGAANTTTSLSSTRPRRG